MTTLLLSHDLKTIHRSETNRPDFVSQVLVTLTDMTKGDKSWGDKRFASMTSSWWSKKLGIVYNLDTKWGLDFVSHALHPLLNANFVRYVGELKELHQWLWSGDLDTIYRPGKKWGPDFVSQALHAALVANFIWYLGVTKELHKWCHHGACVTWINVLTRYKMRTRFCISNSTWTIYFKLCQIRWGDKRINQRCYHDS